jgi:two-component system cell cycle response regulator
MRVVLVDASRTVLKIMTRILEERGHAVCSFTDGPAALKYIAANFDVDALITSAELPSTSGLEMCWETRLLSTRRRPIYIILMSSNDDTETLTEALDSGADDFIGKPAVAEELYARLRAAERLASTQHELFRLASTDSLTGVLNRRAFFERAEGTFSADHSQIPVSVIMFDIDHFKRVNDAHGHALGDDVIRAVAQAAQAATETVGRLGGEEFAILLAGKALGDAGALAERLRNAVAVLQFETCAPLKITCSFGVSDRRPGDGIDELLHRADKALYRAKQNGRNQVVVAGPEPPPELNADGKSVVRSKARGAGEVDHAGSATTSPAA